MKIPATLCVILILTCANALAEGWPTWGGPPGGSKYSPLAQINKDNVQDLEVAWTFRTGDFEGKMAPFGNSFGLQAVPILLPEEAGGHLVLCNPFWNVIALDPVTGRKALGMETGSTRRKRPQGLAIQVPWRVAMGRHRGRSRCILQVAYFPDHR